MELEVICAKLIIIEIMRIINTSYLARRSDCKYQCLTFLKPTGYMIRPEELHFKFLSYLLLELDLVQNQLKTRMPTNDKLLKKQVKSYFGRFM